MIKGKYTEPDILKFKKDEVMRVIGYTQDKELMIVGDEGVYFMTGDKIPKLDGKREVPTAKAEGCDPDKDEFDDWWELKRSTWGGDDGGANVPVRGIKDMIEDPEAVALVAEFNEDKTIDFITKKKGDK